jgi:protein O-mannosyl-transferase
MASPTTNDSTGQKKENINLFLKYALPIILGLTAILYFRAFFNDYVFWDDNIYVKDNADIGDFSVSGLKTIFTSYYVGCYQPLTMLIYMITYAWAGASPYAYHLVNVLLHLMNVWLVFKLAEKLSGKQVTAIVVAFLFAVHPMHVESVVWIAELKDVLYTFFYLLSLLMYIRYIESGFKIKLYIYTLLIFTASMLSKSAAVTLPVLLIGIDIYKQRKFTIKALMEKIPLLALSVFFGILALLSQHAGETGSDPTLGFGFINKIFLISYSVVFYIVKSVAPVDLSAMHYFPFIKNGALPWYYYASLPALLAIIWSVVRRNAFRKEIIFGFFFFLVTISLTLQIIPFGNAIVSERYTYVPYIGLFFIAGQWISLSSNNRIRSYGIAILSVLIIIFSVQTFRRIGVWKNGEILFTEVIKKNPDQFYGYYNRGIIRENNKDGNGALLDFNRAIKLDPTQSDIYFNRGGVYCMLGEPNYAIRDFSKTIELNPIFAKGYYNRGNVYDGLGEVKSAMRDYSMAIILDPEMAEAYSNRCLLKSTQGDYSGALKDIDKAVELTPKDVEVYFKRGYVQALKGDYQSAISDYDHCLELKPDYDRIYLNRGNARLSMNDLAGACEDWNKAMTLGMEAAKQQIQKYCR